MTHRSRRTHSKPYLIFATTSSVQEAKRIAQLLIRRRLAACVNIVPRVSSVFWWAHSIDRGKESLLIIKTTHPSLKNVEKTIRERHSYQVPEIIGWPIEWGSKPYLKWLADSISGK